MILDLNDTVEYLLMHGEGLREYIRPTLSEALAEEPNYSDIPELFQTAYEELVVREVLNYLTSTLSLEYEELSANVTFEALVKLWELDDRGRNI